MSQQRKVFKQRYYRKVNILSYRRPVLLSGNIQSEHVAAGEIDQTKILSNINTFRFRRPVLLSGNAQSEHVASGEFVQTTTLSEQ